MSEQVLMAFDMLLETINDEKPRLANALQEAVLQNKFDEGHKLMTKAQHVNNIGAQIEQLRKTWEVLYENEIAATKTQVAAVVENSEPISFDDNKTLLAPSSSIRRMGNNKRGISEMVNNVNIYRRYGRFLYIISAQHLDEHGDFSGIKSPEQIALFKEEYTYQGKKYRFVKALAVQNSPSALCEIIDREICGKKNTSNGVNDTTFSRHKQWNYSQYPVPSIEELIQNIIT